jgi:pyruvate formate-lyase/glycerol dehydratase family glycyl radical enzyme
MLRENLINTAPEISGQRAVLITESYKETESQPMVIRRARALENILSKMDIYILPGELLFGNQAHKQRAAPIFPEYDSEYVEEELDKFEKRSGDVFLISNHQKASLRENLSYWRGKTVKQAVWALYPEDTKKAGEGGVGVADSSWETENADGHILPGYDMVITDGLSALIARARASDSQLDPSDPASIEKHSFLAAAIISMQAVIGFAKRYSELARKIAETENDPKSKEELLRVSRICEKVPAEPATTFHEALQSLWFAHLAIQIETNGHSVSIGRFDQYMYPYYSSDLKKGTLTPDEALELIECFYIKLNSVNKLRSWEGTQFMGGYPMFQNLTIGGQTRDGKDATNELTTLCLQATDNLRLNEPLLSLRVHAKSPDTLLTRAARVISRGGGLPALFNDEVYMPAMMNNSRVSIEDAYDYGLVGCIEPSVMGKWGGRHAGVLFNLPKCIELALHGGRDPVTGICLSPQKKDLSSFGSFEELMNACKQQISYFVKQSVIKDNVIDHVYETFVPTPFLSSLVRDCLVRGRDIKQGGAIYDCTAISTGGIASAANSLAAIKKLVFDGKRLTGSQVLHALKTDFQDRTTTPTGKEIQQLLRNAPKYGNDDPYVDLIAKEIFRFYMTEIPRYKTTRNGRGPVGAVFLPDLGSVSANVPFGMIMKATPDGRRAGEPVSDVESPDMGTDTQGPTALIKSVSNLDHVLLSNGAIFNLRFHPSALSDEECIGKFAALVRTYFDLGGMEMQFNVVSSETLRAAQKDPQKYKDLVVRVAGYSALFVALDKSLQDAIIARTELRWN